LFLLNGFFWFTFLSSSISSTLQAKDEREEKQKASQREDVLQLLRGEEHQSGFPEDKISTTTQVTNHATDDAESSPAESKKRKRTPTLLMYFSPQKTAVRKSQTTSTPTKRSRLISKTIKETKANKEDNVEEKKYVSRKEEDGEADKSNTKDNEKDKVKTEQQKKAKPLTQMYLDYGQRVFDWQVCALCEMVYAPGVPADEAAHRKHHKRALQRRSSKRPEL
jgi:DNA mismatch repair ATPase MutL